MNRRQRRAQARSVAAPVAEARAAAPEAPAQPAANDIFLAAFRLHQASRLAEAEQLYLQALDRDPAHAPSLHLLGVVAIQTGRPDRAVELIGKSLSLNPDNAQAYSNLGKVLQDLGRTDEALAACQRAVELKPDFDRALFNLGNMLRAVGRSEEAVEAYQRAVALTPAYTQAHYNLAAALGDLGRNAEAVEAFHRAIESQPNFAAAYNNLGTLLSDLGRHSEAIEACSRAVELDPKLAPAHSNLGACLLDAGRIEDSIAACRRAIELKPDFAEAYSNLGNALRRQRRNGEAIEAYRRAIALKPAFVDAHNNLGAALHEEERFEEAIEACNRAIQIQPDLAEAHNNLAMALQRSSRTDEAIEACRKATGLNPSLADARANLAVLLLELGRGAEAAAAVEEALAIDPYSAHAWQVRVDLKTFKPGDPDIETMQAALASAEAHGVGAEGRMMLEFSLGKAWMDVGDADRAFAHLDAGNRLKRATYEYDVEAEARGLEAIAAAFTPELLQRFAGAGDPSEQPIFVVGMPRSGSTLVEQILASHPAVHGAGEVKALEQVLTAAAQRGEIAPSFVEMFATLTPATLAKLGRAYVDKLAALAPDKLRVANKMPANFRFAGLIHLMLPNARIVHSKRDPVDTCLSCYSKNFVGRQRFAYDLKELGTYYRAYDRLMAHWRAVLPADRYLEVAYEDVVSDLEGQARRLVAFCGLEWDEACLKFHEAPRPVRTASVNQVRQPIYRSSLGRWKPYERHLAPLLDAIAGPVPTLEGGASAAPP